MLSIKNLTVAIDGKTILHDISFDCQSGSVHVLMGPNGSGKSTLAQLLAGNPDYAVVAGTVHYREHLLLGMTPEERVRHGLFVVFQNLPAIPGLSILIFLQEVWRSLKGTGVDHPLFEQEVRSYLTFLGMSDSFLQRSLYDGFSGGEKKRFELLQILLFKPRLIIFDEIDSGLDVDALKMVAAVVYKLKQENPDLILICITHYQRLLEYIRPDYVHVLSKGTLVASGDHLVGHHIEQQGYQSYGG